MIDEVDRFHSTISLDLTQFLMRRLKPDWFLLQTSKLPRTGAMVSSSPHVHTRRAVTIIAFTSIGARNTSVATVIVNSARYAITFIEEFHFGRKLT